MSIDPKWLDILKVNGFKSFALAISFGLFLLAETKWGFLPTSEPWIYPLAILFFLVFSLLFVSSILEFLYKNLFIKALPNWLEKISWERKIKSLSGDARKLLALLENDSREIFYYLPKRPEIAELRNSEIIFLILVSDNGEKWGKFSLLRKYENAYVRNRGFFRSLLKYSHQELEDIRKIMMVAERLANGRI